MIFPFLEFMDRYVCVNNGVNCFLEEYLAFAH